MILASLAAITASTLLIVLLCRGDPKRRRATGASIAGLGDISRQLLTALVCLPGVYFIVAGDGAGFLMWLVGSGLAGWLVVLAFATLARRSPDLKPR